MAYSLDLRERIVEAVLERSFSIREAAHTFRVGHATVERYLRQFLGAWRAYVAQTARTS